MRKDYDSKEVKRKSKYKRFCPVPMRPRRNMTQDEFIKEATKVHDGKYSYEKVEFVSLSKKVIITCPIHGDFEQTGKEHLKGQGCPKCRYDTISKKRRKGTEKFIQEAKEIHGNKYDYSKVEYKNSKTKVCLICPEHGEFYITPESHLIGGGCSKCSKKYHYTTEEFIEKAREVHGDRFDYGKTEYKNAKTKVCIICPKHGEFWQLPIVHLRGADCLACSYEKRGMGLSSGKEKFIEKARKVHGDKYNYSKVEYKNNCTPVTIICPEHGEFKQIPAVHTDLKSGCPKCCEQRNIKYENDEWIKKASEVHDSKYDYSKVEYKNAKEKVCIICPDHGEFWQMPTRHLSGSGCPSCNNSKLENDISKILKENNMEFKREYTKGFGRLRCDFYVEKLNLIIECQGEQHFHGIKFRAEDDDITIQKRFEKQVENDKIKNEICKKNGYTILYYTLFKNLKFKPVLNPLYNGIYTKDNLITGKKAFLKKLSKIMQII